MYVDVGKIEALQEAGWTPEKIAEEVHMDLAVIEKAVSDKKTARNKKETPMPEQEEKAETAETEKETLTVVLTYGQMQELNEKAAAAGAREALKTLEQERKKNTARGLTGGYGILSCFCGITIC